MGKNNDTFQSSKSIDEYRELFSLENKVAVVTGAVGHLGAAISKSLAAFGANVILIGRTEKHLIDFIKQYQKSFKNKFEYIVSDVTNETRFKEIVDDLVSRKGKVDILVNNAFNESRKKLEDITKKDWNDGMENILTHVFFCSQAVIPHMIKQGKGSIVNIASMYGFLGIDQRLYQEVASSTVFYSTAKGGILQMSKRFATEYASKGIRINAISPGNFPKKKPGVSERPGYVVGLSHRTPMQRVGHPDEIAGAAVFLASDASSFVTGQNIIVDGGWSAW